MSYGFGNTFDKILPRLGGTFNKSYCSYYLNGTDGYLQGTTNTSALVSGTGKTWSVRIIFKRLRSSIANTEYLLANFEPDSNRRSWQMNLRPDNTLQVNFSSDGISSDGRYTFDNIFDDTTDFYEVIFTYDNATITAYVNGVVDSGTIDLPIPTTVYSNGLPTLYGTGRLLTTPTPLQGYINQVAWTNDVITSTEAATLNNSGSPRIASDVLDNMVQQYVFDNDTFDGTNWTLLDSVSTNNGVSVNLDAVDKDCNENPY